jgi:Co/Zn/Cd efflux system component
MGAAMTPRSPLDDPAQAKFAWARYKRLMGFMASVTLVTVAIAMTLLYRSGALVSIHFVIATALGIGFAMMLMAALMGLVFLSNGTGHDAAVSRGEDDQSEHRGPR